MEGRMAEHGDQRQGGVTGEPGSGFADTAISPPVDDPGRDELLRLLSLSTARTPENYQTLARLSTSLSTSWTAGRKWTESDTAEVRALLAEYTGLRQESTNTINNRIQIPDLGCRGNPGPYRCVRHVGTPFGKQIVGSGRVLWRNTTRLRFCLSGVAE